MVITMITITNNNNMNKHKNNCAEYCCENCMCNDACRKQCCDITSVLCCGICAYVYCLNWPW